MPADALPTPATPPARLVRHVARHLVRTTRARLRRRGEQRTAEPIPAGRVRLVPAESSHAAAWFQLVAGHDGPSAEGLGASPLGGGASNARAWRRQLRRLRAADVPAYVLEDRHSGVVGEALVYVDGGTAAAELVVWAAPGSADVLDGVIAALTGHVLTGDVRRVFLTAPADSEVARAVERCGFASEGVLADPPFAERQVYVRHRHDG